MNYVRDSYFFATRIILDVFIVSNTFVSEGTLPTDGAGKVMEVVLNAGLEVLA